MMDLASADVFDIAAAGMSPQDGGRDATLQPGGDLSGTLGCNGLALCEYNCQTDACNQGCEAMATANAVGLYDTANQCASDWCVNNTHHCVLDAMMNPVDPAGAAMGSCDNCLNDANAMLTPPPSTCVTPGGPDCNPTPCQKPQADCLADKP
jgi:hypothetical protein